MKRFLISAVLTTALLPVAVLAQVPYPNKPLRIVVPYAAGGATDFVARTIGERLAKSLGQPVVVDNKPGAAGGLGAGEVARSKPDGYTVLLTITDSQINNAALFKTLPYDPQKDFAFVTQVVRSPALISVNAESPIKSMQDLKQQVAKEKGKLSYASWGIGGLGHLAGESLNRDLQAGMVHSPQRGEGPVITDLLSKTVDVGFSSVASAKQHLQAGKLTPLAVLGTERSTALPKVPTMRELGFKDPIFDTNVWIAVLLPSKTPAPIVKKLSEEIRAIVGSPEINALYVDRGFEVMNTTPDQFATSYKSEFDIVTKRIRDLGIEAQ
jgi:tripartite-type tricarboxylate transporter receptor subunit TctC